MDLNHKTVKQLQAMCKAAKLKTSGNKCALIERLQEHDKQNNTNKELMKRIRELENTVNQLEVRSNHEDDTMNEPYTSTFRTTVSSPQRLLTQEEAEPLTQVQNELPNNFSSISIPFSLAKPPVSSVSLSNSQYMHVSVPQITQVPAGSQYTAGSHHVHTSGSHHVHTPGVPQYSGVSNHQSVTNPGPVPVYVQPTCATPMYATPPIANVVPAMNVKDIIMVLPDFDPMSDKTLTSNQFVQRVQLLKNAYQWQDDTLRYSKKYAGMQNIGSTR